MAKKTVAKKVVSKAKQEMYGWCWSDDGMSRELGSDVYKSAAEALKNAKEQGVDEGDGVIEVWKLVKRLKATVVFEEV